LALPLVALATLASAPLVAQDDAFMGAFNSSQQIQSSYMSAVMGSAAVGGAAANANANGASHRSSSRASHTTPPPMRIAKSSTSSAANRDALSLPYRSSPEITTRLKREMADTLAKQAPQKSNDIERFVQSADFVTEWNKDMKSYGYPLKSGDVVDAFAGYWLCMWAVANDAAQPNADVALAVRRQVATSMAGNPALDGANDATRQLVAESLITESELALSLRDTAKHSGRDTQALADNTYKNLLAKGIDLRAMQLTPAGFSRR
jgi:hypothetical protein